MDTGRQFQRFVSSRRFSHDVQIGCGFNNLTEALAHDRMIVGDQNPRPRRSWSGRPRHRDATGADAGQRASSMVPPDGTRVMARDPCTAWSRSNMPRSP